jgi:ferrochelatase
MSPKKGLFLLNLGSPDSPDTRDVRRYLKEFLNDPYVIDLPYLFRKLLVDGIILNTRPAKSAEAYSQIWTPQGSPLLIHTRELTEKVRQLLESDAADPVLVRMGMRYGNPSMESVLNDFKKDGITELVFLPLYPQYSYAASESSIARFEVLQKKILPGVQMRVIHDFFHEQELVDAWISSMQRDIERFRPDALLLSYHGIPERQIAKIRNAPEQCCSPGCCDSWTEKNRWCYRAQCFETSRRIARGLGWVPERVITAFQSRLGRTKWIEPYTDHLLKEFPKQGIRRLMVASPSFTADCLETLEEIRIRYREDFLAAGGQEFEYLPCLNSRDDFSQCIAHLTRRAFSSLHNPL